jgi:RNA-directed DNA polymerase
MIKLVKEGKMSKKKFDDSYRAWRNHADHGNCEELINEMDKMIATEFSNEVST